jgi:Outer membrane protein and related peptidoglycan-associated (lipo)proteins
METQAALATVENAAAHSYTVQEEKISQLEKATLAPLAFQVLFMTGDDELTQQDLQRMDALAQYLSDNQKLQVRLDGYADPRGTDEYNNVLSNERALNVVNALQERGVAAERIEHFAHGANKSVASQGDIEGYALERRVRIEVFANTDQQAVATSD